MATRDLKTIRQQEMPSLFLSLAPATSTKTAQTTRLDENPRPVVRRSSSLSSEGSATYRILKLGPVQLGEHLDEHKGDWHEVAVE